uniref:Uncharacterized protein n=2 Tax=Oryza sativa subsp. japonica TaxID=39947 RepID=Q8LMI8_ORYSJ|nr:hypothetical protein [Oryza sativa Japonica Group]ABB47921.1 hypothetical protein LOC_Os10g38680 [Oryza sativa Japonica Group]
MAARPCRVAAAGLGASSTRVREASRATTRAGGGERERGRGTEGYRVRTGAGRWPTARAGSPASDRGRGRRRVPGVLFGSSRASRLHQHARWRRDVRSAAARRQQWRGGGGREMPRENEMGRLGLGFIDGEEAVWEGELTQGGQGCKDRELAVTGASDQAAIGHGGGGQGKKQKREGKRGALLLADLGEQRKEGRARERGALSRFWKHAAWSSGTRRQRGHGQRPGDWPRVSNHHNPFRILRGADVAYHTDK